MGFDVYGESGNYFRNSVWGWRPLWLYVTEVCKEFLTQEDIRAGSYNDGHLIAERKADILAVRLQTRIDEGHAQAWVDKYEEERKNLPLEKCKFCNGTGQRDDEYVKGECNTCRGRGESEPFSASYPASLENIQEFTNFCRESGGFRIH